MGQLVVATANNPYSIHSPNTVYVNSLGGDVFAVVAVGQGDSLTAGLAGNMQNILGDLRIQGATGQIPKQITLDDSLDNSSDPAGNGHAIHLAGGDPTFGFLVSGLLPSGSSGRGRIGLLVDPATPVSILGGKANKTFSVTGGSGRNILISSYGGGTLNAGSGDTILIGGYTDYDTNLGALDAIMREWASIDSYDTRYGFIKSGGGLNGSFVLDKTKVHNNSIADTLNHGVGGRDWYFASIGDTLNGVITSGQNKEHVTGI
jgi:hypothetical protein